MPAGFGYYMYFYTSISDLTNFIESNEVAVIYISDSINSLVRHGDETGDIPNRMISNVALMEVAGSDADIEISETEILKDTNE